MAYPYNSHNRAKETEVLVFEYSAGNSTAASGVKNHIVNLPPGSYQIGVAAGATSASSSLTIKLFPFQTAEQDTNAAALGAALTLGPHGSSTAATLLTAPSTSTYSGTSGQAIQGTVPAMQEFVLPYGLQVRTTCNTSAGTYFYKIIAQQRT